MKSISAVAIALSLVIGPLTSAHAERDHDRYDRQTSTEHRSDRDHSDSRDHRDQDRWDRDHDDRRARGHNDHDYGKRGGGAYRDGYLQGRYDAGRYIRPRGYYQHGWRRGERLPKAYFSNRYVVRNYGAYRLYAPPRGHQWVRVDRDVVLTAVTTGAIVAVVSGLFH
jgi:Ni/Co efflux regulator RcnB